MARAVAWLAGRPAKAFLVIFCLAFSLRAAILCSWMIPDEYIRPHARSEVSAVAVSLAATGRFADPYLIPTGPTAHMPPLPPAIIAAVYRVFGLTMTAGYVRSFLAIAIASTLWSLMPWVGGQLGTGAPAGVLAGFAGAVLLRNGSTEVIGGGDEPYAAIALALLLVAFVRRWRGGMPTPYGSLLLGIAWGVAFHFQPALMPVLVGCLAFELWWLRHRRGWRWASAVALGALLACVPWGWRNYTTFHVPLFVRGNLGLELRVGNHPGASSDVDLSSDRGTFRHPRTDMAEAIQVRNLGEAAYMRRAQTEAVTWIRAHPGEYLRLVGLRMLSFWLGPLHRPAVAFFVTLLTLLAAAGAWRTVRSTDPPARAALLIPFVAFPIVYYVVSYMARYRAPLEWLFLLFAGVTAWRWVAGSPGEAGTAP